MLSSKYGVPALTYRLNRGFRDEDIAMSVGCLRMVNAVSGGVVYTRNPVSPADSSIYINSAWGLPKSVVDGSITSDLFVVSRDPELTVVRSDIPNKERKFVCYPEEGVCRIDLTGETAARPSLSSSQVLSLAKLALKIEACYGSPRILNGRSPKNRQMNFRYSNAARCSRQPSWRMRRSPMYRQRSFRQR